MKKKIILISVLCLLFGGCKDKTSVNYTYTPPININDEFNTGSLNEVNVSPVTIQKVVDSIYCGKYQEVHSILIYKDNKLVFEEYFKGHKFKYDTSNHHGDWVSWERDSLHNIMSVTKSITSICIGIAVDMGLINSVNQFIFDYLPEHQHLKERGKDKITIEHLLTMTSGLDWNEWALPYGNLENDVIKMYLADDQVAFVLNKPLMDEPGTSFKYSGGNNILLGEILKTATKMKIDAFSGKYLFEPLGIIPYYWSYYESGIVDAAGSIRIKPRDMVKLGVTFLNDGMWNGKRIVSKEWIDKSATSYPGNSWMNNWDDHWGKRGYGYMWWTHQFVMAGERLNMYYAAGWGGQFIMVIPKLEAVVVFTGGNYVSYRPPFEILKSYILTAFK